MQPHDSSQKWLIVTPLLALLDQLRAQADDAQGYGPANILVLLHKLRGHLRGLDLSHLSIRGAYLHGVEMQDASLAETSLRDMVLNEAFDIPWSVAISRNGQHWAAGSRRGEVRVWREEDQTIWLWDVDQSSYRTGLHGHTASMYDLAFTPDSRSLLSGSEDRTLCVWDVERGRCVHIMQGYAVSLYDVAWSPDGKLLASASYRRGIHVWEVTTGTRRWVSHAQPTRIRRVVWSPDGTRLASGGGGRGSGELFIWDTRNGERLQNWKEPNAIVDALTWDPTGEVLLSGGSDGSLCWWNVQHRQCLMLRQGHQGAVQSLRTSPDGRRLASCGDDNIIQVWNLQSGELLHTLRRDRLYERLNITGIRGLSEAQKATLRALGAFGDK